MSANTDGTPLALTAAAAPELASNRKRRPPLSFQFPKSGCPGSKHDATIVQMVDDGHSWADIEAVAGEAAFDRYYCMLDPDLAEFWTLDAITTLNTTVRELAGPSSFAYNVGYVDDIQPLDDGLPWDAIAKKIKSTVGQCSHVWRTFGDGRPASEEARAEAAEKMRQKKLKEEKECDRLSAEEERVGQAKKQEKVFLAAEKERKRVAKEMEQARLAKKHERQARATEAVEAAEKLRLRRIKVEGEANARAAEARKALLGRRKVRKEYRQRTTSADSRSHSPESSWNTHMPIGRDKSPNPTLSDLTPTPGSPTRILADMRENERRVPRWARVPARSQVVTMEAGHAQKLQGLKVLVQNLVHKEQHKRQQRKQDLATFMDSVRASRHWRSAQMQEEEEEQKQLEALDKTNIPFPNIDPDSSSVATGISPSHDICCDE
ncbi:hypothetical protein EDD11_009145 [Mortierella claussenii]|nr:hypothetical protein EDD11_009145 [Mortierella claussenii]